MKKKLFILGVLAVSFVNAQQGNVGVNTDQPKATLEVKSTGSNLVGTTNEGIIAPQLSKSRVAAIVVPVEGTLVYVTDDATSTIASYTGGNTKVAKIDEKGYYFYNGIEWVKVSNEWIFDPTTKRVNLKRSGIGTFKNLVYYDSIDGKFINTDIQDDSLLGGKNNILSSSSSIPSKTVISGVTSKLLNNNYLIISKDDATPRVYNTHSRMVITNDNTKNYSQVYKNTGNTDVSGTGTITNLIGTSEQNRISNSQSISDYTTPFLGVNLIETSGTILKAYAILARNTFRTNGGKISLASSGKFTTIHEKNDNTLIDHYYGVQTLLHHDSQNTGNGTEMAGVHNVIYQLGKTKYTNLYGIYSKSIIADKAIAPTYHYGLYIENIKGATTANYAIYTGEGKVYLGDEVEVKGSLKVASTTTNDNCTQDKAGTIRFKDNKFQGCTGTEWKDLHN